MSNMAYHRCHCGYETDVSNANSVFEVEIHCRKCGYSASESEAKISSDLANMLCGFSIDSIHNQPHDVSMPPTPQVVPQLAPIAYISQHYTHSNHMVPQQYSEISVSDALAAVGVNASALLPSQIQLFRHAQPDQQARLIELWQIAPPTHEHQLLLKHLGYWPSISLEMEEEAARKRWARAEQEKIKNLCAPQGTKDVAEPYMVNGYQNVAQHNGRAAGPQVAESERSVVLDNDNREWSRNQELYRSLQQVPMQSLSLDQDEEMEL